MMQADRPQSYAVRPRQDLIVGALTLLTLAAAMAIAGPSLAARDLLVTVEPIAPATDNTTAAFNITVNNTGDAAAGSVDVQLYVDGTPFGAVVSVGQVAAGGSTSVSENRVLACGSRILNATVDPADSTVETNESNNNFTLPLNVLPYLNITSNLSGPLGAFNLTLNASASHGCEPLNFTWTMAGVVKTGAVVVFTPFAGNVTVNLTGAPADANFTNTVSIVVAVLNLPPTVSVTLLDDTIQTLSPIYLAITGADADGFVEAFFVDFGNGNNTTDLAEAISYEYPRPGNFTITVRATDNLGASNETVRAIQVANQLPDVAVSFPYWVANVGEPVHFGTSRAVDPEGGALNFTWDFGDGTTGTGPSPNHSYAQPGNYRVNLTVTDPDGGVFSQEIPVTIPAPSTGGDALLIGALVVGGILLLALLAIFWRRRGNDDQPPPSPPASEGISGKPPSP